MIDWFASGLELVKMACIAKRMRVGFIVGFMSCIAWTLYVWIFDNAHGILLVIIPAMAMNVWGYIAWGKVEKKLGKMTPEGLARLFHSTYEELAPEFGYETRPETREFDPKSDNGKLMIAVCEKVICELSTEQHEGEKVAALKSEVARLSQALSASEARYKRDIGEEPTDRGVCRS